MGVNDTCPAFRATRWSVLKSADLADFRSASYDALATAVYYIDERIVGICPPDLDLGHECERE